MTTLNKLSREQSADIDSSDWAIHSGRLIDCVWSVTGKLTRCSTNEHWALSYPTNKAIISHENVT